MMRLHRCNTVDVDNDRTVDADECVRLQLKLDRLQRATQQMFASRDVQVDPAIADGLRRIGI